MEIFVESAGFDQQHDYNWVNQNQKIVEEPQIVKNFTDLLQIESPSLLIARENDQLLLLVTGIKSKRRDYQNRINRISVAWIGTNQEEPELRTLAVLTLRSFLKKDTPIDDIEKLVTEEGENGFTVDFAQKEDTPIDDSEKLVTEEGENSFTVDFEQKKDTFIDDIEKLVKKGGENGFTVVDFEQLKPSKILENLASKINVESKRLKDDKPKIDKKDDTLIQELATELERYCLPDDKEGALVVVTGIKKRETLENANVWRGLGNLIESPTKKKLSNTGNEHRKNGGNMELNDQAFVSQRIVVPVLAVFLCISLSLNIWLYTQSNQQNQKIKAQNEKIESLNQQIQTLTIERDNGQKLLKSQ